MPSTASKGALFSMLSMPRVSAGKRKSEGFQSSYSKSTGKSAIDGESRGLLLRSRFSLFGQGEASNTPCRCGRGVPCPRISRSRVLFRKSCNSDPYAVAGVSISLLPRRRRRPLEETPARRSFSRSNLAQAGENLGCGHGSGFPGIETCDAARNLRIPSGISPRFGIELHARKKSAGKGNTLVRRKHKGVARQGIKG